MANLQLAQKLPYVEQLISAVSTDTAIEIMNFGPRTSIVTSSTYADASVNAGGDLLLRKGSIVDSTAVVTASADTNIGSPTLNGTIDLSSPAAAVDTYGEVADLINSSQDWRCRLVGVRRADLTNNTLIDRSTGVASRCNIVMVPLLRDTTTAVQTNTFTIGLRITPKQLHTPAGYGWLNSITDITANVTFAAAGTGTGYNDGEGALNDCRVIVYSINDVLKTQRRVWYSGPLTTGVTAQFDSADWKFQDLTGDPGEDLLVLVQNSGTGAVTLTAPTITVNGYRQLVGGATRTERWVCSNS